MRALKIKGERIEMKNVYDWESKKTERYMQCAAETAPLWQDSPVTRRGDNSVDDDSGAMSWSHG